MRTTSITLETVQGNLLPKETPAWLDWRRTSSVRQELFRSVKEDDQIASTRSFSASRWRRSSRIQNLGTDVSFRVHVFSILVNSNVAELLAKRRRTQKEIPVLCGSILCRYHPVPSSNPRPLWRKTHQSYIARQRVVAKRLRRVHMSRWKLTRYALDRSFNVDWFQLAKTSRKGDMRFCRESNVHQSISREGLRRDEAQDCSVQTQLEHTPIHSVLV